MYLRTQSLSNGRKQYENERKQYEKAISVPINQDGNAIQKTVKMAQANTWRAKGKNKWIGYSMAVDIES